AEQFGKTMRIPDELMRGWFELLTDRTPEEIAALTDPAKTHPRQAKATLARDIVSFYHGAEAARKASDDFDAQFRDKKLPSDIPEVVVPASSLSDGGLALFKLLVALDLARSGNEARRLVQGGGVAVGADGAKMTDANEVVKVTDGLVVRAGKKIVAVKLG